MWTPNGTPGNGDIVQVAAHTVTVDSARTIGLSGANSTTPAIEFTSTSGVMQAYANLTVRGDIQMNRGNSAFGNQFVHGQAGVGGVTVEFDSSAAASPATTKYRIAYKNGAVGDRWCWKVNGISSAHCILRSNAGGGNAWLDQNSAFYGGYLDAAYLEVLRFGDASNPAWVAYLDNYGDAKFAQDHVTWDTCGKWGLTGGIDAGATISLNAVTTKNELNATYSMDVSPNAGSVRSITGCSFTKRANLNSVTGATITGNIFQDCYDNNNGGGQAVAFDNNIIAFPNGNNPTHLGPSTTGNYWLHKAGSNPHWISVPAVAGTWNILGEVLETDTTSVDGDGVLTGSPGASQTVNVKNCILLPNTSGAAPGKITSPIGAGSNVHLAAEHNTFVSGHINEQVGITYGETNLGYATEYTSVKSNLAWSASATDAWVFSRQAGSTVQDVVTGGASSVNYNGKWNPNAGSDGSGYGKIDGATTLFSSGSPGANDVTVSSDPFVDKTRNIKVWSASLGGASTVAAALSLLSNAVDITQSGNASATPANLLTYVKNGFKVTAASLNNAGHDGVTIGAMAYQTGSAGLSGSGVNDGFPLTKVSKSSLINTGVTDLYQ